MKHIKYYFIILSLLICTYSCKKDFLNIPDKTVLLQEAYITDLKTTNDFLNGIYLEMGRYFYWGHNLIYPDLVADNLKPSTNSLTPHYTWNQLATEATQTNLITQSDNSNAYWLVGYKLIRACSFLINNTDKFRSEDPAKADDIKGQAYAIRALLHSIIVNVYAQPYSSTSDGNHVGVPYIASNDFTQPVSRQTVREVYEKMIADLQSAIGLLSPNTNNKLFMNSNAAKALLARVYLFKGDYSAAKNIAREVGTTVPIMTGANYPSKLFTVQETEALLQLPPATPGASGGGGEYYTAFAGTYLGGSNQEFVATNDIASILTENPLDVRRVWVIYNGTNWNVKKYPSAVVSGMWAPEGGYYQTVFRSSEMYLIAAESYAKINNEDSARFYLDAIRKRANSTLPNSTATGQALIDSIYKERRKELCFEGLRMFDLLRWKKPVNRIDAPNPLAKTLPYPSDKAIAPIPVSDVNAGMPQNPGY